MTNIYKCLSVSLTKHFINNNTVHEEDKEIYEYGFEILLSTIVYTIIFALIAIHTNTLIPSITFLLGFFVVRTIAGGFHAKTYFACHILFCANHIVFVLLCKLLPVGIIPHITTTLLILSALLLLMFAPVDHPHKPFVKNERKKFRMMSLYCVTVLTILAVLNVSLDMGVLKKYLMYIAIGTISATIALLITKIKNVERRYINEEDKNAG